MAFQAWELAGIEAFTCGGLPCDASGDILNPPPTIWLPCGHSAVASSTPAFGGVSSIWSIWLWAAFWQSAYAISFVGLPPLPPWTFQTRDVMRMLVSTKIWPWPLPSKVGFTSYPPETTSQPFAHLALTAFSTVSDMAAGTRTAFVTSCSFRCDARSQMA